MLTWSTATCENQIVASQNHLRERVGLHTELSLNQLRARLGETPTLLGAQPQIPLGLAGRAQPFRTSGGKAANAFLQSRKHIGLKECFNE
jgi:hypothetical protein